MTEYLYHVSNYAGTITKVRVVKENETAYLIQLDYKRRVRKAELENEWGAMTDHGQVFLTYDKALAGRKFFDKQRVESIKREIAAHHKTIQDIAERQAYWESVDPSNVKEW